MTEKKKRGLAWLYVNFDFIELCPFSITLGCSFPYLHILDIQKPPLNSMCAYLLRERHRGGGIFHSKPILIDMQKS